MYLPERGVQDAMEGDTIVQQIVTAVAEADHLDPIAVRPPLADVVDPEALEQFVTASAGMVRVTFEYRGWTVEVRADGSVSLSASSP